MDTLIHPGDWWILALSIIALWAFWSRSHAWLGIVLTVATTLVVTEGYGLKRGILHLIIMGLLFRVIYYARQRIDKVIK